MNTKSVALSAVLLAMMLVTSQSFAAGEVLREWTFDRNADREGWTVPERLTGAVMGGSIWLTPTPKERDPTLLASLNYQIYGDYDAW